MNRIEAIMVLRKVKAYHPAQLIDDITMDAWHEAFDDIRVEDALLAVRNLGRASSAYLDPARIRTEVQRLHEERKHAAHQDKCYICTRPRSQCEAQRRIEERRGLETHDFETLEDAKAHTSSRQ